MERVFHKSRGHDEAAEWDVLQRLQMTADQREMILRELQRRYYGENVPDVRESRHTEIFSRHR